MMRLILLIFFCLFAAQTAEAQVNYGVSVTGPVTPNDCVKFASAWVIQDAGTTCGGGGGGGSLTVTDGTNSVANTTTLTVGNGFVVGGSSGSATVNYSVPDVTKTTGYTIAASNMAGQVNFNGSSITATIPAISSTVFASGMTGAITNFNASNLTLSSTPTINGYPGTAVGQYGWLNCTSNGTSLDCFGAPGFGTITNNALEKFSTTSGISTSSGITDNGTTVSTSEALTVTGTITTGITGSTQCLHVDSSGVVTGTGSDCGSSGGSGTVSSGTFTNVAFYQTTGTTVIGTSAVTIGTTTNAVAVTSAAATALTVGANGATNPVLTVDDSTASVATGVAIKGAATGGTTTITATDSGSNTNLSIQPKGTGTTTISGTGAGQTIINGGSMAFGIGAANGYNFQWGGSTFFTLGNNGNNINIAPHAVGTGSLVRLLYTPSADTAITASTNAVLASFAGSGVTRQHSTGALTLQTDYNFGATTTSFVGASTVTDDATINFSLPGCGTNATCTNFSGIYHASTALTATGTITNSYAINVSSDTGATNNYAARLNGPVILPAITSDAALTDSTVCQDTTNHQLFSGSGTLGICLGTSSIRYKNNVISMQDGLKQIMGLKPVNFYYNDGHGDNGAKQQYGFIAEDVVNVLPKLTGLDKDGKPNSVDILGMVPVLVQAVQQQQNQINAATGAFPFHKCFFGLLVCAD